MKKKIRMGKLLYKLRKISFLATLDASTLGSLIEMSDIRLFEKNEVIFEEGEYEESACILLSGSIGIWLKNKTGKKELLASYGPGEIFGEVAVLSGSPRTASVLSNEPSEILYMDKNTLFFLMDSSKEINDLVNERYREKVMRTELNKIKIFSGLPSKFFEELKEIVKLKTFHMDEPIVSCGEESTGFHIVIYGFAKVMIPDQTPKISSHQQSEPEKNKSFKIVAYLAPGQHFGELGLIEKRKRRATVSALTRIVVGEMDQIKFHNILTKYCDVKDILETVIANRNRQSIKSTEDETQENLMDWVVSSNIIQTNAILLIDLEKCIKCETCIKTCEKLYGASRLVFDGLKYNNLLFPASCRHCHDPQCLVGCPTGAISRDFSGEVYHQSFCIGCGNCARRCPFGNITIVDRKKKVHRSHLNLFQKLLYRKRETDNQRGISVGIIDRVQEDRRKKVENINNRQNERREGQRRSAISNKNNTRERRQNSPKIATKCDNCKDFPYMACVRNCPRGAAQRVNPREYFKELLPK